MIVGPEHIGRQVQNNAYIITVLAVGDTMFFGRRDDNSEGSFYREIPKVPGGTWHLIEPKKKPSQRLLEIFRAKAPDGKESCEAYTDRFVMSVCNYLDEQAAKE